MKVSTLGEILSEMYTGAPEREAVAMIHLFGIKFSSQINSCEGSAKDIAIAANINESYATEISKGAKLAKFVIVK